MFLSDRGVVYVLWRAHWNNTFVTLKRWACAFLPFTSPKFLKLHPSKTGIIVDTFLPLLVFSFLSLFFKFSSIFIFIFHFFQYSYDEVYGLWVENPGECQIFRPEFSQPLWCDSGWQKTDKNMFLTRQGSRIPVDIRRCMLMLIFISKLIYILRLPKFTLSL